MDYSIFQKLSTVLFALIMTVSAAFSQTGVVPPDPAAEGLPPERTAQIGTLLLPPVGYGLFSTGPHNTGKVPGTEQYIAEFALWVGGLTESGSVFVISGDGNEKNVRPEWIPDNSPPDVQPGNNDPVHLLAKTAYTDNAAFEGHTPAGLEVSQKTVTYAGTGYAVMSFDVTNTGTNGTLKDVFIGLKAFILAPGYNKKHVQPQAHLNISAANGLPYIRSYSEDKTTGRMTGLLPIADAPKHLAWWAAETGKLDDTARYQLLKGTMTQPPDALNRYTFLISAGPFDLVKGDSRTFAVVIANTTGETGLEAAVQNSFTRLSDAGVTAQLGQTFYKTGFKEIPESFGLMQNYPNPFNSATRIEFRLKESAHVKLAVYDVRGREIARLCDGQESAGIHSITWDGMSSSSEPVSSGMYFYRIIAKSGGAEIFRESKRMIYLK
ncbi:FlgD immunoglobulin-like domain containing protein [candidate division KSB1 bacterium]